MTQRLSLHSMENQHNFRPAFLEQANRTFFNKAAHTKCKCQIEKSKLWLNPIRKMVSNFIIPLTRLTRFFFFHIAQLLRSKANLGRELKHL